MRANLIAILSALTLLGGCATDVGQAPAALGEGGVCEPTHVTPILVVSTGTDQAGTATMNLGEGTVDLHFEAAAGWELGDFYVYMGPGADSLVLYQLNPEPWVTGWQTQLDLTVPFEDLGLACGEQVKIIIQGYSRDASGREFVSALAEGGGGEWGWWDFYDLCCEAVDEGCTLTQGYWKNHADAWPVTDLQLGTRTYTRAELLGVLHARPRGDASIILAHQLIAAELNHASGASASPEIAAAQSWMAANGTLLPYGIRTRTAAGAEAVALAGALASYNEGATGPGHCED